MAEKEAQKSHVGFDSVDYTLRTGDGPDERPGVGGEFNERISAQHRDGFGGGG